MTLLEPRQAKDYLEQLIERYGVKETLALMSDILSEKAMHIGANWQDENTAQIWEHAAKYIATVSINTKLKGL